MDDLFLTFAHHNAGRRRYTVIQDTCHPLTGPSDPAILPPLGHHSTVHHPVGQHEFHGLRRKIRIVLANQIGNHQFPVEIITHFVPNTIISNTNVVTARATTMTTANLMQFPSVPVFPLPCGGWYGASHPTPLGAWP